MWIHSRAGSQSSLNNDWTFRPAQITDGTASFKYYTVETRLYRIAEGTVLVKVGPGAIPAGAAQQPDRNPRLLYDDRQHLIHLPRLRAPGERHARSGVRVGGAAPARDPGRRRRRSRGRSLSLRAPAGFTGSDSFTYTIQGYRGVQSSTVATIYVLGSPNVVANPDYLFTKVGTRARFLSTDLVANDTAGVAFIRPENPQHGTLEIAGIGPEASVYDFVPEPGFAGTASFEYLISPNGFEPYTRGSVDVYVTDDPPTAVLAVTCAGLDCSFNASGSTDDLGISSYAWTFGDGATGSGATASHAYSVRGNFQAGLTVTDTGSQTSASSRVVSVDALPVARFTFPARVQCATLTPAARPTTRVSPPAIGASVTAPRAVVAPRRICTRREETRPFN